MDQPGTSEQERRTRLRVRAEDAGKIDLAALRQRFKDSTGSAPPAPPEPAPVVPEPVVPEPLPPAPVVAEPKAPFPWLRWARGVAICAGALAVLGVIGWLLVSGISSFFEGDPGKQAKPVESLPAPEPKPVVPEPEPVVPEPEPVVQPKTVVKYVPVKIPPGIQSLANAGDVEAQFLMGCLHAEQSMHPKNARLMVGHWRRAAEAGHPLAIFNLAVCRQLGLGGLTSNPQKANVEFRVAEAAGFPGAQGFAPRVSTHAAPQAGLGWLARAGLSLVLAVGLGVLLNRYRSFQLARAETMPVVNSPPRARVGLFNAMGGLVHRYGFIVFVGAWIGMVLAHKGYLWGWVVGDGAAYHESFAPEHWLAMSVIRTLLFGLPVAVLLVGLLDRWGVNLLASLDYHGQSLPAKIQTQDPAMPRTYGFLVRKSPHILILATLLWQYCLGPELEWPFYACVGAAGVVLLFLAVMDMDVLPQLNIDVPSNQRMYDSESGYGVPQVIRLLPLAVVALALLVQEAGAVPWFWVMLMLLGFLVVFSLRDFNPLAEITTLTFKPVPVSVHEGKPTFARRPFPEYLLNQNSMACAWWGCGLAAVLMFALLNGKHAHHYPHTPIVFPFLGWSICAAIFLHIVLKKMKRHGLFHKLGHIVGLAWLLALACFFLMGWLPEGTDLSMRPEMSFLVGFMTCGLILMGLMIKMKSGGHDLNLFPSLDVLPDSVSPGRAASSMTLLLRRKSRVILLLGSLVGMFTVLPAHEAAAPSSVLVWLAFAVAMGIPVAAMGALIQSCHGADILSLPKMKENLPRGWVYNRNNSGEVRANLLVVQILPCLLWGLAVGAALWFIGMGFFSAIVLALVVIGVAMTLVAFSEFFKPLVFHLSPQEETTPEPQPEPASAGPRPWVRPTANGLDVCWAPLLSATAAILVIAWVSAGWLGNQWSFGTSAGTRTVEMSQVMLPGLGGLNKLSRHQAGFLFPANPRQAPARSKQVGDDQMRAELPAMVGVGRVLNYTRHSNRLGEQYTATVQGGLFLFVWKYDRPTNSHVLRQVIASRAFRHVSSVAFTPEDQLLVRLRRGGDEQQVKQFELLPGDR